MLGKLRTICQARQRIVHGHVKYPVLVGLALRDISHDHGMVSCASLLQCGEAHFHWEGLAIASNADQLRYEWPAFARARKRKIQGSDQVSEWSFRDLISAVPEDFLRTAIPELVRHRTTRSKGCLSNKTARAMVFKLVDGAQKNWRRLDGHNQLPKIIQGVPTGSKSSSSRHSSPNRRLIHQAVTKNWR